MRRFVFVAAVSLALGCAPQAVRTSGIQPGSGELTVLLLEPARDALRYTLSEPAYVAVFTITQGAGVELVLPAPHARMDQPRRAGLNQESLIQSPGRTNSRQRERRPQTRTGAFYVIASRSPLPVEALLRAAEKGVAVPTTLQETADALAGALTEGLPAEAWDADVYVYPPNPSTSASRRAGRAYQPCAEERAFNRTTLTTSVPCKLRTRGTPLQ